MSDFIIKFPTRSRPEKFKKVFEKYIAYLSGQHSVKFIVTMDEDDDTMNTPEIREWFDSLTVPNGSIKYNYGQSKTKIEACNADMEGEKCEIIVLASDDMVPCIEGYDDIIAKGFDQCFPDYVGAIKFNDGLRPKEDLLMTLTVIGYPLYECLGNLYHPEYESVYPDNELTTVCARLNLLAISPTCIIRHEWVQGTHSEADELHQRQESVKQYAKDGAIFKKRTELDFEIEGLRNKLLENGYIKEQATV